jgi:hypothetical protein
VRGSILLTVAEYDPALDHPIQTFQVPYPIRALGIATHNVVAKFNDNWGSQYTCVYRVSLTRYRHGRARTDILGCHLIITDPGARGACLERRPPGAKKSRTCARVRSIWLVYDSGVSGLKKHILHVLKPPYDT